MTYSNIQRSAWKCHSLSKEVCRERVFLAWMSRCLQWLVELQGQWPFQMHLYYTCYGVSHSPTNIICRRVVICCWQPLSPVADKSQYWPEEALPGQAIPMPGSKEPCPGVHGNFAPDAPDASTLCIRQVMVVAGRDHRYPRSCTPLSPWQCSTIAGPSIREVVWTWSTACCPGIAVLCRAVRCRAISVSVKEMWLGRRRLGMAQCASSPGHQGCVVGQEVDCLVASACLTVEHEWYIIECCKSKPGGLTSLVKGRRNQWADDLGVGGTPLKTDGYCSVCSSYSRCRALRSVIDISCMNV